MRLRWWKLLSIVLVFYSLYFGMMGEVPSKDILNETIRNLYYHVPMWFCMILLFSYAFVYAIRYLSSNDIQYDLKSAAFNKVRSANWIENLYLDKGTNESNSFFKDSDSFPLASGKEDRNAPIISV